jgi:intracellular multiplication protein IcmK
MMKNSCKIALLVFWGLVGTVAHAQGAGTIPSIPMSAGQNTNSWNTLPPQVQNLLKSQNIGPAQLQQIAQQAQINPTKGGLPTGLAQQKQLLAQMNSPAGGAMPSLPARVAPNNQAVKQLSALPATAPQPAAAAVPAIAPVPTMVMQPTPEMREAKIKDMFEDALDGALPLKPQQIQEAKARLLQTQRAAAGYMIVPPKPVSTSLRVDLAPGADPPVIRQSQGFISSLVFVDATGAPWPIESLDLGNSEAFQVQWNQKGHILMVQATKPFTYGNLAVKLINLDTPVMLTLIPGQKVVDYRVDLRIMANGPNATAQPIVNGIPSAEADELMNILEGIAPTGSKALQPKGGDAQAWLFQNKLYLRTRMSVLSPGWLATLSSPDGMHAFMLQPTPTVLVAQNGKAVQLKIEGL